MNAMTAGAAEHVDLDECPYRIAGYGRYRTNSIYDSGNFYLTAGRSLVNNRSADGDDRIDARIPPQMTTQRSVAEALAAANGTQVVVTGELVQQVDGEHLLLRDSSGQVNVEVDKAILGKVKFGADSHLRILGKMDRTSERSLLIAKTVEVVN